MEIIKKSRFKAAYKKIQKSGNAPSDFKSNLKEVLDCLVHNQQPPMKYQDHPLKGDFKGYRDCHVCSDLVLIYSKDNDSISLAQLLSHSDFLSKKNRMQN